MFGFCLESLVIDKMLDPSSTLLNDSCHPNIEIGNNALQHACRNSPNFAFVLKSFNCWRIILLNPVFQATPENSLGG